MSHSSLTEPIAVLQWPNGKLKLKCGKCDAWIGGWKSIAKCHHGFREHQKSVSCMEISRRICTASPSTSLNLAAYYHHDPETSQASQASQRCPGISLREEWPSTNLYATYLWHFHDQDHGFPVKLKWKFCSYDEPSDSFFVRSVKCEGTLRPGSPKECHNCTSVRKHIRERHDLVSASNPPSQHCYRPWAWLATDLTAKSKQGEHGRLDVSR